MRKRAKRGRWAQLLSIDLLLLLARTIKNITTSLLKPKPVTITLSELSSDFALCECFFFFAKYRVDACVANKSLLFLNRTINVEYNQLDPLLRASGFKDGDVNDKTTGYSPYPGNINQLLFKVKDYVQILERTKGLMPEFVNPKYADASKTKFKKPTRLECMMQDFPSVMNAKEGKRVGFTSISAAYCFSPVKNATADGVALQEKGTHPGTAATGEADQYAAQRKIMNLIGCNVETAKEKVFSGITVNPGPAIVLKPDFVTYPGEYEEKFPFPTSVSISARSTLIVRGSGVKIESLKLDGTLIVDYPDGEDITVRDLVVENEGWVRIVDDSSEDEVIKMRGYKIEKREQKKLVTDKVCTIM